MSKYKFQSEQEIFRWADFFKKISQTDDLNTIASKYIRPSKSEEKTTIEKSMPFVFGAGVTIFFMMIVHGIWSWRYGKLEIEYDSLNRKLLSSGSDFDPVKLYDERSEAFQQGWNKGVEYGQRMEKLNPENRR